MSRFPYSSAPLRTVQEVCTQLYLNWSLFFTLYECLILK